MKLIEKEIKKMRWTFVTNIALDFRLKVALNRSINFHFMILVLYFVMIKVSFKSKIQ